MMHSLLVGRALGSQLLPVQAESATERGKRKEVWRPLGGDRSKSPQTTVAVIDGRQKDVYFRTKPCNK